MKSPKIFITFFIACLASLVTFSQASESSPTNTPATAKENPGSLPVLVSLERVSKDLHLTSLQKSVIAGLRSDYRAAALKITQAKYKTSSELAQAQAALDNLSAQYNHRTIGVLNAIQRRRLREIERQVLGGTMLTSFSEQQHLGLTEQQKMRIAKIDADSRKKATAINLRAGEGKIPYHQQVMDLRKNRQKHADEMLRVLTPVQLRVWNESKGEKLSMAD